VSGKDPWRAILPDLELLRDSCNVYALAAGSIEADPRAEAALDLAILPRRPCRRQPIAAELSVGESRFGQIAEALVTVGGSSS